ncbi:MAG: hypothetical protein PHW87_04210 [Methanothrix sp.]|nr:hypothetical protein [Methanothrix sp.]
MSQLTQEYIIPNLGAQTTNILTTALAGAVGAIIGALFTFYLNYAKTKAMMKWETKYNAYNAILKFDKGLPIDSREKNQEIRFAKRLKALSKTREVKEIADTMIEGKFESLADKQIFIDEKFIPAIEKDLEDTMNFFKWQFWK